MINLIKRNVTIYFANRTAVFFSLLASLISFILYILFLKNNMQQSFQHIPDTTKLLDPWLIGGTLSVTGLTSIGTVLSQLVADRESHRLDDLAMTDLSQLQIQSAYLVGAVFVGTFNQIVVYLVMSLYFQLVDGISVDWSQSGSVLLIALFSSLVWTAFNLIVYTTIQRQATISTVSSIISTISGFFAGVYVPISVMPSVAQTVMKFTPTPYVSAAFRDVIMHQQLKKSFQHLSTSQLNDFRLAMGIDLKVNGTQLNMAQMVLILGGFLFLFVVWLLVSNYFRTKEGIKRAS
ncbi:ABC transporter permease [Nicoliella spurrieriana]|uniref:ABC transporter permease n=1 Tax=Nicoliella spurrieriana TaxID=2925830 RepID=A0A976RTJ7_9LACO|nr:ABC transporter permease [Nicoliella spurrieriana]UQS87351.1 ABC transporter permease [Nicoliella spurrieriana]